MDLDSICKKWFYFHYIFWASLFEVSISVLFLLIGMILFADNFHYYFLASALLGGLWSYRLNYMYTQIRVPFGKTKWGVKYYFQKEIGQAVAYKIRNKLSVVFSVIDIGLLAPTNFL